MAKPKAEEGEAKLGIDTGSEEIGNPGATGEGDVSDDAGNSALTKENNSTEGDSGTVSKDQPQELEDVCLLEWPSEREGIHTIHTKDGIFNFINGRATFKVEIASKLREAGYIE
jgi:hypothetical protein